MAKITWVFQNESGTNLNRYIATNVNTGEEITFDLLRGGNISVVGTPLNAENMNSLIESINALYDDKLNSSQGSNNANKVAITDSTGKIIFSNKIPSSNLPSTGVAVETAKNIETTDGTIITGDEMQQKFKDMTESITAQVICKHLVEITGNTGDEHGLAIEDQQALIPRIQGQTLLVNGVFKHSKNNLISTGRNVWDEEWESGIYGYDGIKYDNADYIRNKNLINVIPNVSYFIKQNSDDLLVLFYDLNKNLINYATSNSFITPNNCYYIDFTVNNKTYNNDICINVSDESFNGTYEPYKQDIIEVNKELKAFDFIQSSKKVVATGEYTFTGNENISKVNGSYPLYQISLPSLNLKDTVTNIIIKGFTARSVSVTSYSVDGVEAHNGNLYFQPNPNEITTIEQMAELLIGETVLYETATPTITDITIPAGYGVYKGGYQIQSGEVPYVLTKEYSLNTKSQVLANIEIDREQQAQINWLKENGGSGSGGSGTTVNSFTYGASGGSENVVNFNGSENANLLFNTNNFNVSKVGNTINVNSVLGLSYSLVPPTSANTSGLKIVILDSSEYPQSSVTQYNGYLYLWY